MALDIGRIAYSRYAAVILERDNRTLPDWSDLGKTECDAWRHAAVAVLQYIDDCKNQDPNIVG